MARSTARPAELPTILRYHFDDISKADFAEAAINLAALAGESADDYEQGARRLLAEVNLIREQSGRRPIRGTKFTDWEDTIR